MSLSDSIVRRPPFLLVATPVSGLVTGSRVHEESGNRSDTPSLYPSGRSGTTLPDLPRRPRLGAISLRVEVKTPTPGIIHYGGSGDLSPDLFFIPNGRQPFMEVSLR